MALELGFFGLIVLVSCCIAAGACAAVIHSWALRAQVLDQEYRLSIVEGQLTREVKARAGAERWKKPDRDQALAADLLAQGKPEGRKLNWWEKSDLPRSANAP